MIAMIAVLTLFVCFMASPDWPENCLKYIYLYFREGEKVFEVDDLCLICYNLIVSFKLNLIFCHTIWYCARKFGISSDNLVNCPNYVWEKQTDLQVHRLLLSFKIIIDKVKKKLIIDFWMGEYFQPSKYFSIPVKVLFHSKSFISQ